MASGKFEVIDQGCGLSLSVNPATGIFSGSFKVGSPQRSQGFAGIFIHEGVMAENNQGIGLGCCLVPGTADPKAPIGSWDLLLRF